jgi:polysaccharide biosynthesis/export protein
MKRMLLLALSFLFVLGTCDSQLRTRPRYTLHAGDTLDVKYRLTPEFDQTVTLDPDGHATLNLGGDVQLAGLTLEQVKKLILDRASERLKDPELNVILKDYQKPYVMVSGEVQTPVRLELREDMTALQALQLAGGPKISAKTSQVVLYRRINGDKPEVKLLNLKSITQTGQLERDMRLEPGDILFIPVNKVENLERYLHAINFGSYIDPMAF